MLQGTPSSSMLIVGSGVITVRAEKSTRFPIKLPLIRPSLAFSLLHIDLMGRPDRCVACTNRKWISQKQTYKIIREAQNWASHTLG